MAAGSGRPPRPSLAYFPFHEPLGAGRGPLRAPAATLRRPLPPDDSPQGGACKTAPQGGGRGRYTGRLPCWPTGHG